MSISTNRPATAGFGNLDLHPDLVRGVEDAGFSEPRPIQSETLPPALRGADVLGLAQTGTGKTAAFALPLLHRLLSSSSAEPGPRALVLAPTRELASQIDAEIRLLARFTRLGTALIFGGAPIRGQVAALRRRPEIVVACPGRLLDLLSQRAVRLDRIETLVLDEADHMFDMGFLPSIRRILAALPRKRQNLFFSATMPREIRRLADEILVSPHVVTLSDQKPAATIEHVLHPVPEARKRALLDSILRSPECTSAIVFTRTKRRTQRLAKDLDRDGHRAVGLQGNLSQGQRDRAMRGFRERRFDILVATDIAARGIDVSGVSHVINFDVPNTPEAYTHRIGRTGRSENAGRAATFVTADDWGWVRATERRLGAPIPRVELDRDAAPEAAPRKQPARARRADAHEGGERRNAPVPRRRRRRRPARHAS